MAPFPLWVVVTTELDGHVDEEILARSVRLLTEFYPALSGRLVEEDGGWWFRVPDERPDPLAVHRVATWEEVVAAEPSWPQVSLGRVSLHVTEASSSVALAVHRSLGDGMATISLNARLWRIYTALSRGEEVTATAVEPVLPEPIDDLLLSRYSPERIRAFLTAKEELGRRLQVAVAPPADSPGPARLGSRRVRIDESRLRVVRKAAHEGSVTLNCLVSGVLLATLRRTLDPVDGPLTLVMTSAVDMRRRVDPHIPNSVLQSAASASYAIVDVAPGDDCLRLARDLSTQLTADLDQHGPELEIAAFPQVATHVPPVPISLIVTNPGRVRPLATPDDLHVTGVRVVPTISGTLSAVVSEYQGTLSIDFPFGYAWHDPRQIEHFAAETSAALSTLL